MCYTRERMSNAFDQPVTFYSGPDYLALPRDPQKWIIKGLIQVGGLTNVYGKPKTGKSFLTMGMGLAIANGEPEWNGFEVMKHGPVAYLQIDTPREEWADRMGKLTAAGYDITNLHTADMNSVPYPFDVLGEGHFRKLQSAMERLRPVMVVIDTLRESFSGDENDSNTMRNVIANLVAACRPSAIVLLSHARKDGVMHTVGGEDMMDDNRGSSYVPGRMDTIIRMSPKQFSYKGRASGLHSVRVEQDETLGLIYLHGQKEKHDWQQAARAMLAAEPAIAQREAARRIAAAQGGSAETIRKAIAVVFKQHEAAACRVH
jgi:hypothetical protein